MQKKLSFFAKLTILAIGPLVCAQLITLYAVMRTVESDVERRARSALSIGGTVVDEFLAARDEQLRTSIDVLAGDFGLKQAVATGDTATINSVLNNHIRRINADAGLILDIDGALIASTVDDGEAASSELVQLADQSGNRRSTLTIGDATYHAIAVPLMAPTEVGYVVLGFRIDDALANRLNGLTGLDVTIAAADPSGHRLLARNEPLAPAELARFDEGLQAVYVVAADAGDWLTLQVPFVDRDSPVHVVLQRSLQESMQAYDAAREKLILFSVALLLCGAVGAAYVSGGIAKPVQILTAASRRISSGDYLSAVEVGSDDEFGELAASFNAMRTAISEREARISHQATHDSVTNLPNRDGVAKCLNEALALRTGDQAHVCVLAIKLRRLDSISSVLGLNARDEVLAQAARSLLVNLRAGETLGYVGTGEFLLILNDADVHTAHIVAERIDDILAAGVTLEKINITLQTEIGIASCPAHGDTAPELIRSASIARTEAAARGERIVVFQAGRQDYYVRQLRIVNDLRSALHREEVLLHFQPKISLPDGTLCGAESLVRWEHPEFGFLPPDEFIPAAEQAGTIVHLTRYVLARSVAYCRQWLDQGLEVPVAVNLSARDLQDEYLPHFVQQLVVQHDLPPGRLTLEITENRVMQDLDQAVSILEALRDIGVRISVDDFGTGHSSLAQLKHMPLHELKIDKSFIMKLVEEEQNLAIVHTIVDLAHNMQLDVIAEGVENEDTLRRLSDAGCEQAQGYFISKPLDPDAFADWCKAYEPVAYPERRGRNRPFAESA